MNPNYVCIDLSLDEAEVLEAALAYVGLNVSMICENDTYKVVIDGQSQVGLALLISELLLVLLR